MSRIDEDIKSGSLSGVYLLYGEEDYLKRYYRNAIKKAVLPDDDNVNINVWYGKDVDIPQVAEQANTVPFFAEKRLIILMDTGLFKKADDRVLELVKQVPPWCVMVFSEREVDGRSKLFKEVQKSGVCVKYDRQKPPQLIHWLGTMAKKRGSALGAGEAQLILDTAGDDMEALSREMEKLLSYCEGRETITRDDILALVPRHLENHIFILTDMITSGDCDRALACYYELLSLKESPLGVLALMYRQFDRMHTVRSMRDKGLGIREICDRTGMKEFVAKKLLAASSDLTPDQIMEVIDRCARTETSIKQGHIKDEVGVELLIIRACSSMKRQ